jgi:hypothetical protein
MSGDLSRSDSYETFALAVITAYREERLWGSMAEVGPSHVVQVFSRERQVQDTELLLRTL